MKKSLAALLVACTFSLASVGALAKENVKQQKLAPVIHTCTKKDRSVDALSCNVYQEARGESLHGQLAVAFVTVNRMKKEKFPESVRGVVYQKNQFSWTRTKTSYKVRDPVAWDNAKKISKFVYSIRNMDTLYEKLDPTYGSLYYHTTDVKPYWAKFFKRVVKIGPHVFYKEKEKENGDVNSQA